MVEIESQTCENSVLFLTQHVRGRKFGRTSLLALFFKQLSWQVHW